MRKIIKVSQGHGKLEVRVYASHADRQRALAQIKCYKVSFQDVQGPAIQLIKEMEGLSA